MNYVQKYLLLFLRYSWLAILLVAAAVGFAWIRVDKEQSVYGSVAVLEVTGADKEILNIRDLQNDRIAGLDAINTVVETLTSNDVMLRVAEAIGRTAEWAAGSPSGKVPPDKENGLAMSVRGQVRVALKRGTRLIEISTEDGSPAMAQKIADQIVVQFLKMHDLDVDTTSGQTIKDLMEQEKQLFEKLNESSRKRDEFAREKGIDIKKDALEAPQSSVIGSQYAAAASRVISLGSDLEVIKKAPAGDVNALLRIPAVANLPDVVSLRGLLNDKEAQFAAIQDKYLEKHPKYIEAELALTELRGRLNTAVNGASAEINRQLETAKAEQERLRTMGTELQPGETASADYVEYQALQRSVQNDQTLYDDVKKRRGELQLMGEIKKLPYKYVSKPLLNPVALRPDKQKSMTDAGLIGLAIAAGVILLIDRLDSRLRTVDEAEKQLGLPVLAAVPDGKISDIPKGGTIMTDAAGSNQAEAFRTLRASLSLVGDESRRRLLLVTSAIPAEGKTFTSINLAACLACQGYRTLLVDADLRRPALSAALLERDERKGEQYRGLSDVLSGNIQPSEAVRSTTVANLFLMPAGRKAPNPSELLSQASLPALLKVLEGQYDRIVFDTAPINAVSDTLGIAPHMHSVVLVLRFGSTAKRAVQRALLLLKKAGAKMAGLVMNRVPARRGASYYYYYYGDPYITDSVYGTQKKGKKKSAGKPAKPETVSETPESLRD